MKNKLQYLALALLLVLGIFTRFHHASSVPGNLQPDSVDTIRSYLEHKSTGRTNFFSTNWNGAHIVNQWLIAVPWDVAGQSYGAAHLTASLASILIILLFYLVSVRISGSPMIAFIVSALFLVDPWFVNFSRSGWENILNCFGVLGLILSLFMKSGMRKWLLLFFVALVSPYLYHPGKIISLVAFLLLLIDIGRFPSRMWEKLKILLVVVGVAIVSFTPLAVTSLSNQLGRISTVSIFSHPELATVWQEHLQRNWLGFLTFQAKEWHIGVNSRYVPLNDWVLHPFIVFLYMVGTIAALKRKPSLVIMGILLVYPVNLFSQNTPDAARTIHAFPYIYGIVLYGVVSIKQTVHSFTKKLLYPGKIIYFVLGLTFFALSLAISCQQMTHYWLWINDARTLFTREPAIYNYEYDRWLTDIKLQIEQEGRSINIYEWKNSQN